MNKFCYIKVWIRFIVLYLLVKFDVKFLKLDLVEFRIMCDLLYFKIVLLKIEYVFIRDKYLNKVLKRMFIFLRLII